MNHKLGPRALIIASAIVLSGINAAAQTPQKLEFEVASIKPNNSGDHGVRVNMSPCRFVAKNVTVKLLITQAFNVKDFQIGGGPAWMASEHFDIDAKTGGEEDPKDTRPTPNAVHLRRSKHAGRPLTDVRGSETLQNYRAARVSKRPPGAKRAPQVNGIGPTPAQMMAKTEDLRSMMQSLLADRFKFKSHEDSKEAPAYALVVGKGGPRLKPNVEGAEGRSMMRLGHGQLTATRVTMDGLAGQLANHVGRPVINKTGLSGEYDVELEWTPDPGQSGPFGGPPPGEAPPPVDSSGPSIFTAVQDKLGLKLEGTKAAVKMIVIDAIEKPSEN